MILHIPSGHHYVPGKINEKVAKYIHLMKVFKVIAAELFFVKVIMIFIISPFSFYNFSFICLQFNLKDNNVSRIQNQNCKEISLEFANIFILLTNHLTYSYI